MKEEKQDRVFATVFVVLIITVLVVSGFGIASWFDGEKVVEQYGEEFEEPDDVLQFVSGTEYVPGQEGQVAVVVADTLGDVVTGEYTCNYTVLYPNKTMFVSGNFSTITSLGTYYTTFTIPNTAGVYEYGSVCEKTGKKAVASKSFHVSTKRMRAVIPK